MIPFFLSGSDPQLLKCGGEPEAACSVGGNSLPKALNRKIHAEGALILRLRLLVWERLGREGFPSEDSPYEDLEAFADGLAGGVGRAPATGFVGSTGAAPRAVIAASRLALAAATAAL